MDDRNNLDRLLDQWQDVPACDPQMKHHVWTRIASSDNAASQPVRSFFGNFLSTLSRPLPAIAFVTACVVCGILFAEVRVSTNQQARSEELARNYVLLVNSREALITGEIYK